MKQTIWIIALSLLYACGAEKKEDTKSEPQKKEQTTESIEEQEPAEVVDPVPEEDPEEGETTEEISPILCMESEKVASLIKDPDPDSEEYDEMADFQMISESDWNGLTDDEKFVYCFAYPEWFDQVCAESAPYREDRLFSGLPWDDSGASMSTRQSDFISNNRAFVMDRMWECIEQQGKVSDEFLRSYRNLKAYEIIPSMVELYNKNHNNYILSLFMELMSREDFPAYTAWYKGSDFFENYETEFTGVELTEEIEAELIQMATDFYAEKMRP